MSQGPAGKSVGEENCIAAVLIQLSRVTTSKRGAFGALAAENTAMIVSARCGIIACAAVIATSAIAIRARAAGSLYAPACGCEIQRAGFPAEQSCLAAISNPCVYTGYFVGGSKCSNCNERGCCSSGTWGWDYLGKGVFSPTVRLSFRHPAYYQGGSRGYEPDGPRPCERVFADQ
jgi:hypothetical protein